jgi:ring-1,2-phenylacetyl-CoA epoxidase subunit PaaE
MVDDEETTFENVPKQTIFEAALVKWIDPYPIKADLQQLSCSCNSELLKWQNSILTDGDVCSWTCSYCQAHPTSESVYVDYDDV